MNAQLIGTKLGFEILQSGGEQRNVTGGYTSDLLSDVMANAEEGALLVTIQAHKNSIAVASLAGCPAVVLCNNRPVPEDMVEAAREEEIALYRSEENQFTVSGKLYALLLESS
jgi:hypothetical protein